MAVRKQQLMELLNSVESSATGLSQHRWDRLRKCCEFLLDGPLDTSSVVSRFDCERETLLADLRVGHKREILKQQRRYTSQTNGGPGGQKDALWSLNPTGIRAFAAANKKSGESKSSNLTRAQKKLLETADWSAAGLNQNDAYQVCRLIEVIEPSRTVSIRDLALELGVSHSTVKKMIDNGEKAEAVMPWRPEQNGHAGKPLAHLIVDWTRIEAFPKSETPPKPSRRFEQLGSVWPKKDRLSVKQRKLLKSIDPRRTGRTANQWSAVCCLIAVLGDGKSATTDQIARELGVIDQSVEKAAKWGKAAAVLDKSHAGGCNPLDWTVDWSKLEQLAGVKSKIAIAKQEAASPGPNKGGRPPKWKHFLEESQKYLAANPDLGPSEVRSRYRDGFPKNPVPSPHITRTLVGRLKKPHDS